MAEATPYTLEGSELGGFSKAQFLAITPVQLRGADATQQIKCLQSLANSSIKTIAKHHKHQKKSYSRLHVTNLGIYLYEAADKGTAPSLRWGAPAKQIYSIVMGKKQKLWKNQFVAIFHVVPGTEVRAPPQSMDCIVIEFHHDRKGEAAKFHEATEAMMHGLLFSAMADLSIAEGAGGAEAGGAEAGDGEAKPRRRSSVVLTAGADDDEEGPGYMDLPDEIFSGPTARASIEATEDDGADYLCVFVPRQFSIAEDIGEEGAVAAAASADDFE